MGRLIRLYKTLLLIYCASVSAALAADAPTEQHFYGVYDFSWTGVGLGNVALGIEETADGYHMHAQVHSKGIVNLFTRHTSNTEVTGTRKGNRYQPLRYESHYMTKKKPRHVKLAFDEKGVVTEEFNDPPEDRSDRPEVPHSLKDGAVDPLTALLLTQGGAAQFKGFDAKRLYEVKSQQGENAVAHILGERRKAVSYVLSRKPLGGMTAKEQTEYNKGEPPLTFYFSDDAKHTPLGVHMPIYLGSVQGVLVKECNSWDECKLE